MMIIKTYARVFTNDADKTLELFEKLHRTEPHLRFNFNDWELIAIGDTFIVGGTDESLASIRDSHGPYIVDNLDETRRTLLEGGAEITLEITPAPTGRFLYAGWINCRERIFEILLLSYQPPADKSRANSSSTLKRTAILFSYHN